MREYYILCPSKVHTGGPELLHQLCYKLNSLGLNAKMLYCGDTSGDPVHENYKIYNNEYIFTICDSENNTVIIPEIFADTLLSLPKSTKVLWWLSVDNFTNRVLGNIFKDDCLINLYKDTDIYHLVQSQYAKDFITKLIERDDKTYYLSDYLNKNFIENCNNNTKEKSNNVLYNPKKGYEFTKKIIEKSPHLNWIPLEGYTQVQLANLMQESKVYIDFGNHPGKDRIPREAAISGCCVITGLRGSAKFHEDIPISDEFKFNDTDANIDNIINKIEYILNNYDSESLKFNDYKTMILNEESVFEENTENIFKNIIL